MTRSWRGNAPLRLDAARILRVHRYTDPGRIRPPILAAAARAAARAPGLAAAEARMRRLTVEACADGVLVLDGGHRFRCPAFDQLLAGCVMVEAFVLTLGPALDEAVAELHGESDLLGALFLESAGWLLVEQATRRLRGELAGEVAPQGLSATPRLGPGYDYRAPGGRVGWPLEQQHDLFAVFGDDELPVSLLDSSVMLPKMSRSGIFGLRPLP